MGLTIWTVDGRGIPDCYVEPLRKPFGSKQPDFPERRRGKRVGEGGGGVGPLPLSPILEGEGGVGNNPYSPSSWSFCWSIFLEVSYKNLDRCPKKASFGKTKLLVQKIDLVYYKRAWHTNTFPSFFGTNHRIKKPNKKWVIGFGNMLKTSKCDTFSMARRQKNWEIFRKINKYSPNLSKRYASGEK